MGKAPTRRTCSTKAPADADQPGLPQHIQHQQLGRHPISAGVLHCLSDPIPEGGKAFDRVIIDTKLRQIIAALPGAKLGYLENPTSWTFTLQDLPAIAQAARNHGVISVIDNLGRRRFTSAPQRPGLI